MDQFNPGSMSSGVVPNQTGKQSSKDTDKVQAILREFGVVQSQRGVWESHWQEIAERIWPAVKGNFNPFWYNTPGQKKNEMVFDSTASMALNRFAAIMDSLLTPRNQTWHRLQASNPNLNKMREVKLWFEEVNKVLFHFRYNPRANFASQNQGVFKYIGGFGSGCMFTDSLTNGVGIRYRNVGLGECYFLENHQGIVDKVFRYFPLTVRQAIQKWGDSCPESMHEKAKTNPEFIYHFIHLVEPRDDVDPVRLDYKGMPFASYYICKEEALKMEESGYRSFPYAVSRYEQAPGEVYGRSPAMDLLPAIKTLNEQKKTNLKAGHRQVDPVLLAHDDGILDSFSLKPGAINYGGVTADGRPLVHALPTGNYQVSEKLMDEERKLINDGFMVSLFQILTESPQMTATEVLERTKEKGILLAPTIGRQQSEYLGPLIERELDILMQQGMLPTMPGVLKEARGEYKIVYDSPLNRAQRADEAAGLMRTVESFLQVVNITQDPTILDPFDWDKIVPDVSDIQGIPYHWMKDPKVVQQVRQQRAQQQQEQQAMQGAPGAAAMMKAAAVVSKGPNGGTPQPQ